MDTILIAQRKQRLVWGVATLLVALLGLAQRDQRGLLTGPDTPTSASAFAAITPQSPGMAVASGGGQGAEGVRRLLGRSGSAGAPQFAAGDTAPPVGTSPSAFDQPQGSDTQTPNAAPSALLALADPGSGGAVNAGPGSGGGGGLPTISPGGPQQTVSAAPGAVPEAPMWAIMILGIGGIGCMARRERALGRSLLRAAA